MRRVRLSTGGIDQEREFVATSSTAQIDVNRSLQIASMQAEAESGNSALFLAIGIGRGQTAALTLAAATETFVASYYGGRRSLPFLKLSPLVKANM
jgi:hypothetical protein